MSSTTLVFGSSSARHDPKHYVYIGPKAQLTRKDAPFAGKIPDAAASVVAQIEDGREKSGKAWSADSSYTFAELETKTSRHLGPVRSDLIESLVRKHVHSKDDVELNILLDGKDQVLAAASAVARSFSKFSRKKESKDAAPRTVAVNIFVDSQPSTQDFPELDLLADAVRHAALLVDTPTAELNTTALVKEVEAVGARYPDTVRTTVISGEALKEHGLGALYGVGKAASAPPALAVLEYTPRQAPAKATAKLSLVGKGIVYDTGGLSIKSTAGMCEMKTDMGGAAALLTAFEALVKLELPIPVVYVGCIAENAVGPDSQRNDDIVTSLSGKSIEINNTDAEGRLVLADGIAYTTLHHSPTHVLDMATLTGAQMIATGMHHAGIMANRAGWEDLVYAAGQRSGDWCFPLLYAPEVLFKEFESKVADMKNSVRSRTNAQASCAGHFVEAHIGEGWEGEWCHVDIAGPSFRGERATGFGAALVIEVAKRLAQAA